jgi:membrane protein involved in D-alanine export
MSFYTDLTFFIWLIILILPAFILGIKEKSRKAYTLGASLFIICLVLKGNPRQLVFMALFYLLQLHIVKIYLKLRKKYGRNGILYGHFILLSLLPLILCKLSGIVPMHVFEFLGISYLTFKGIQIIIEIYDGVIQEIDLLSFTAFLLFFPSISSGPIDRSRRFGEDFNRKIPKAEYLELAGKGLEKILLGMVYKFVLAALLHQGVDYYASGTAWTEIIAYAYFYGFYMFFDFAGYSLMAIGSSYFFGIQTPENFNKPFISKDIKEFWDRWHITLSHWFRDFIFSRFMMKSIRNKWFSTRLQGAAAGFIVNMFIMGIWHGLNISYLCYGLYHGCLLAATEVYQKKSKFYKKHKKSVWYQVLSWAVTLQMVMFGFLIFSGHFLELLKGLH